MTKGETPDFLGRVRGFIRERELISPGEKAVVAVSGGADSVCLLHVLSRLRRELEIELHVAHLNHGLRPDARADAGYVRRLARRLGLPVTVAVRDVRAYQRQRRLSLEEAARLVRYEFLAGVARDVGAARVAAVSYTHL
ncbi:MAG: hypothetical protein N2506_07185, partial [Dehalococcoidales bacterium]|nr:hypothetical protein [Dehalococcoidales bacterium]